MSIWFRIAAAAAIGYLAGCVHPAYLLGRKLKNIDIREHGSNNSGASNATIVLGWKYGVLTAVVDIAKGALAVLIARYLVSEMAESAYLGGFCAIMGHMFPFYLRFRGGKGLATVLGYTAGLSLPVALILGALLIAVALATDYIVLGTVCVALSFFGWTLYRFGISWQSLMAFIVTFLILWKHRENYVRILNRTETKVSSLLHRK